MGYITEKGRAALASYVYKGSDLSLLYKHVLSPWAQFCVDYFTPRTLAPNTITLIGLLFQVAAYVVLATESASFSEPVAPWKAAFAAFCLFTYATLDNMDGKQARKIGASSPLGLLFDHGCDAINTGMLGSLIFAMVIRAEADSWQMYVIWSFACTGFFMNTWEEFHIREFILPIVNGPSEGLTMMTTLLAATAYYGQEMWSSAPGVFAWVVPFAQPITNGLQRLSGSPVSTTVTNKDLVVSFSTVFLGVTCLMNSVTVVRHMARVRPGNMGLEGFRAICRTAPMWVLHLVCFMWFQDDALHRVIKEHSHVFYLTGGALFAEFTSTLMISHVADQKYRPNYRGLVIFGAGPLVLWAANHWSWSPETMSVFGNPNFWLFASFVNACTQLAMFMYTSISEIAAALDIDVFDVTKQVARKAAAAAAAK